ncbi:hypothetical protein V2J09_003348 [Rumex salicifolius]
MAELALFGFASKLTCTIASPSFKEAYERVCSIKKARIDLDNLERSIQTIQAVLLDVEKNQKSSAVARDWIKRVKDDLRDADDLFDQVATIDLVNQQTNNMLKTVLMAPSRVNVLEKLELWECPALELWEEGKRGVDWDSLSNLHELIVGTIAAPERLPNCLKCRQALGKWLERIQEKLRLIDEVEVKIDTNLAKMILGSTSAEAASCTDNGCSLVCPCIRWS